MCQCVKKSAARAPEGGRIFMPPPIFGAGSLCGAQAAFVDGSRASPGRYILEARAKDRKL